MIKKICVILIILHIILLLIPMVNANTYGANKYGCGLYGIGCVEAEEEVEELPAGSLGLAEGSRGGGCNVFADYYKKCFHIDPINLTCQVGCAEGYYCDEEDYRCKIGTLITKTITETLLESAKGKKAVIISLSVLSLVLLGFIAEEETKKKRKFKKQTEKIIKEATKPIVEKGENA